MLVAQRPASTKTGDRRQDDVGLDEPQAVEVERQCAQHLRRQIGDDDIGGRDQLLDDLAAFRGGRVEGHPELVAVHRQKHRAPALGPGADRDEGAILAAAQPLDADHLGAEIGQECRAERACDVTPEIQHANAFEHTGQWRLLPYNPELPLQA